MNCASCGTILRGRVVNIDFWSTTWQLIESPKKAFEGIIYAEHKNMLSFISVLAGFKFFLISSFIFNLIAPDLTFESKILPQLFLSVILFTIIILLFSLIIKSILKIYHIQTRFKDNLALILYSTIPVLIIFTILFPIEFGIFGGHWIYFNPSPFLIKFNSAIILAGIELVFILWSFVLLVLGLKVQSQNIIFSITMSIVIYFVLIIGIGIIPAFIGSLL
jgi:hypothetical protein